MKRHPSLIPLSHDHHDTLVVAQGLIVGRSRAPRSDWPPRRREQVDRVVAFFTDTLQPHFETEEMALFPLATQRLPDCAELIRTLRNEHDQVRSLMFDFKQDPTTELEERLPALGRLLEGHIRKEERVLFQAIQRELNAVEMATLGERLALRRHRASSCQLPETAQTTPSAGPMPTRLPRKSPTET